MRSIFSIAPNWIVGLLLLAVGWCAVPGCASVGGQRSGGLIGRTAQKPNLREKQTNSKVDREFQSTERLSFQQPKQLASDDALDDDLTTPGHLAEQLPAITGKKSNASRKFPIAQAGHAAEEDSAGIAASTVVDAAYRSDRDAVENPIQLLGVKDVDLPDGINILPDRGASSREQPAADAWSAELNHLIKKVEAELASIHPTDDAESQAEYRRKQVNLRLLYLIARHPEQALTAIPSLEPAEQEYWQQLVWAVTDSLDQERQPASRDWAGQAISPLNSALRKLREQADLVIKNAAFCEEISYFGNYNRFPRDEFVPGQPVLLYAEIENFRSEPVSTGEFRTSLRSIIEIQEANGQTRWNRTFDATEDLCRNPRRDYFHNYQFTIPESLRLGPHLLKLTVVDELSRKQAVTTIRFVVK